MNKRIGPIGGLLAVVVAVAGVVGYPVLQEFKFKKDFGADLRRLNRQAVEQARQVEDDIQVREFYAKRAGDVRALVAAREAAAPPKGKELLRAVLAITNEFETFQKACFDAIDAKDEAAAAAPAVLAQRADGDQILANLDAAADLMAHMPERAEQSRERLRVLISTSGADEETRVTLWHVVQASHERLARIARMAPRNAPSVRAYADILRFLRMNKDAYYVAVNGAVMFNDAKLLGEYRKMVMQFRLDAMRI